jgi:hypothetical protein
LEGASGDYLTKAQEMIAAQKKLNEENDKGGKGTKAATKAVVEQTNAFNLMVEQAKNATVAQNEVADAANARARTQIDRDLAQRDAALAALSTVVAANEEATEVLGSRWSKYFADLQASTGLSAQAMVDSVLSSVNQIMAQLEQLGAMRQAQHEDEAARIAAERAANVEAYHAARDEYHATRAGMTADERARAEAELALMQASGRARGAQLRGEQKAAQAAAVKSFQRQTVAAIGQTFIDAALASMKAIAQFGPPPSPPGIAALAAAGATQAVSIGMIAAQKPPTFHRGGSPDEVAATLTRNEAVLNPSGVAAMGGEEGIKALNRGERGGSGGSTVVMLNDRVLDVISSRIAARSGVALRTATGADKPGSRSGYR